MNNKFQDLKSKL